MLVGGVEDHGVERVSNRVVGRPLVGEAVAGRSECALEVDGVRHVRLLLGVDSVHEVRESEDMTSVEILSACGHCGASAGRPCSSGYVHLERTVSASRS